MCIGLNKSAGFVLAAKDGCYLIWLVLVRAVLILLDYLFFCHDVVFPTFNNIGMIFVCFSF